MTTLTITDAKKNLGRWLKAAVKGEDVGIVCGADILALRKVEVRPVENDDTYAMTEYGVTRKELDRFQKRSDKRYRELKRKGKLIMLTAAQLKEMVEKASRS